MRPKPSIDSFNINVIAFDLGNVLLPFDPWKAVHVLGKASGKPWYFIAGYLFLTQKWTKFDKGMYSKEEFYTGLNKALSLKMTQSEFERSFADIFSENPKVIASLGFLKARYRLILLSDINPIHAEFCFNKYNFFDL